MKVKIKSFNGELPKNLTVGKIYDCVMVGNDRIKLTCDDCQEITSSISKSGYLSDDANGGSWEIVE